MRVCDADRSEMLFADYGVCGYIVAYLILTHTDALKVATEAYLSGLLKDVIAVVRHSRSSTARPGDVQLVRYSVGLWGKVTCDGGVTGEGDSPTLVFLLLLVMLDGVVRWAGVTVGWWVGFFCFCCKNVCRVVCRYFSGSGFVLDVQSPTTTTNSGDE